MRTRLRTGDRLGANPALVEALPSYTRHARAGSPGSSGLVGIADKRPPTPQSATRGMILTLGLALVGASLWAQTAQPEGPAPAGAESIKELSRQLDKAMEMLQKQARQLRQAEEGLQRQQALIGELQQKVSGLQKGRAPMATAAPGGATSDHAVSAPAVLAAPAAFIPAKPQAPEPFGFADFSWLNGNCRQNTSILETKYFTGEFRLDANYVYNSNHPQDHSLVGSCETGRTDEFQVQQLGIGGDFHWDNVRGRLMTQFGMYSTMTPRNDASPSRGQWDLATAYRYISEAYGGYHFDKWDGINVDVGIFMSYVGLFSYYQFDNWAYQPSYVSANTPWFFNGARIQVFPNDKLKVELWIVNGWQSYGKFNSSPGLGFEIRWTPNGSVCLITNNYWGRDTLNNAARIRVHTDNSLEVKYYDKPEHFLDKMAFTLTVDAGAENGGGVTWRGGTPRTPAQYFLGFMLYNRFWFNEDRFALTVGGGAINNPGRYLVLMPPINGATAASGTPYFTANPGDPFKAWDFSLTFDYMPNPFLTWRAEFNRRMANVPYFSGPGGITPPGGNEGAPGSLVPAWKPDLVRGESQLILGLLVKF